MSHVATSNLLLLCSFVALATHKTADNMGSSDSMSAAAAGESENGDLASQMTAVDRGEIRERC